MEQQAVAPASIPLAAEFFDRLPDSALVDVRAVAALRGVSSATIWRWSRLGILPKPYKAGPNSTRWKVGDLRKAMSA